MTQQNASSHSQPEQEAPKERAYQLLKYKPKDGPVPFDKYLKKLKSERLEAKIERQLKNAAEQGHFGDIKQLSGTLFELRLRKAEPETRIYIVKKEREGVIIVLSAGTKDTQAKDIKWCKQVAKELKSHEQLTENY